MDRVQVPWILNSVGRPMFAWKNWPACCSRVYAVTLLRALMRAPHLPGPPAICEEHGDVRARPDAP